MPTLDIMDTIQGHQDDGRYGREFLAPSPSQLDVKRQPTGLPSPPSTVCPGPDSVSRPGSSNGEPQSDTQDDEASSSQEDQSEPKPYPLPPQNGTKDVLPEDINTPDSHVSRDPRLIRLTGIHPFNAEAPLTSLYDEGFLTSEDLHFVRNHGPVPECDDADILNWEFTIEGMVEKPIRMTLKDLLTDYDQVTYPITIVCAGNRRKEQNMVRKSKGFSWGPAGLSTALWTGVPIGELLSRARPKRGARYVCFEGADKLPNGYYGTSVKLNWCMDMNRGILVAHKMNGELLHPDHGKPLRIVVPGQIGGRSVKWLRRIIVTADPSDNWYHIYDNRVLPTDITPEASADLPEVWKDEKYAIYDLNANSAICYPAHGETVNLKSKPATYTVRGYAYGGGGRRITRVEVTLDRGKSWNLAHIKYPEDDYRLSADGDSLYDGRVDMWWRETSFCWSFWEVELPLTRLAEADDVIVRAMDESLHVQPRDMYWSVLGMMNNNWFRVVIHKDKEGQRLSFEHPTQPALIPGGWMERIKNAGGDLTNGFWGETILGQSGQATAPAAHEEKHISMVNPKVKNTITLAELKAHSGKDEPWFVVDGEVYDGTPFLDEHPGGPVSIFGAAGLDASEEFITVRKLILFLSTNMLIKEVLTRHVCLQTARTPKP